MPALSKDSPWADPVCLAEDAASDFERDDMDFDVDIEIDLESLPAEEFGHA
jgi:hypothetical protein